MRKYLIAALAARRSPSLMASVAVGAEYADFEATTKLTPDQGRHEEEAEGRDDPADFVKNRTEGTTATTIDDRRVPAASSSRSAARASRSATSASSQAWRQGRLPFRLEGRRRRVRTHVVGPTWRRPLRCNFNVTAYVGGKNLIVFYIAAEERRAGHARARVLTGKVSKARAASSIQKLVIDDPGRPAAARAGRVLRPGST